MSLVDVHGEVVPKVLIAVPCGAEVKADFARDLAMLVGYTTHAQPAMELPLYFAEGTYVPRARAALVEQAIRQGCTHILWLDSDMRFPKDTLLYLLHAKVPIVAANYPTRHMPIIPTAVGVDGVPLYEWEGQVAARHCGMGVMLTEVAVFQRIGKPYFALGYNKAVDDYAGEDVYFCEMARKAGYTVWVDRQLSEQVEHCGGLRYTMNHARMAVQAAAGVTDGPDDVH